MASDRSLRRTLETIDRFGWAVVGVGGATCSEPGCDGGEDDDGVEFSYTVGLSALGFPEVITYGLPQQIAGACLNLLGHQVRAGRPPVVGGFVGRVFEGHPGYLIDVQDTSDLVVVGQIYPEVVAAQLVWSDRLGRFPWHPEYVRSRSAQPLMGRPPRSCVGGGSAMLTRGSR